MAQIAFHSPTHTMISREILCPPGKKISVVDYGCGEGELLQYLTSSDLKKYLGFEVNKPCIPIAKKKWRKIRAAQFFWIDRANLPSLGEKNAVDFLVLVGVVQYLPAEDWAHVLLEAKRVLKPGGKILISCTTDHRLYSWLNIYRLFMPHFSVNRSALLKQLSTSKFRVDLAYERGVFFAPFFSNIFVFFFDAMDKVFYRTKGELGPIGRKIRALASPVIQKEFELNLDFGYTLFVVASKNR